MRYFEAEGTPSEPQTDEIWVLDADGELTETEVPDDAEND